MNKASRKSDFVVVFRPPGSTDGGESSFHCRAPDEGSAVELCQDSHPGCACLGCIETDDPAGALQAYSSRNPDGIGAWVTWRDPSREDGFTLCRIEQVSKNRVTLSSAAGSRFEAPYSQIMPAVPVASFSHFRQQLDHDLGHLRSLLRDHLESPSRRPGVDRAEAAMEALEELERMAGRLVEKDLRLVHPSDTRAAKAREISGTGTG